MVGNISSFLIKYFITIGLGKTCFLKKFSSGSADNLRRSVDFKILFNSLHISSGLI